MGRGPQEVFMKTGLSLPVLLSRCLVGGTLVLFASIQPLAAQRLADEEQSFEDEAQVEAKRLNDRIEKSVDWWAAEKYPPNRGRNYPQITLGRPLEE
jgi:hypothetical protein